MFVCPVSVFQNSSIMISFSDVHDFVFYQVLSYVWGSLMHKIQAFLLDFNCFTWKTSQPSPLHLKNIPSFAEDSNDCLQPPRNKELLSAMSKVRAQLWMEIQNQDAWRNSDIHTVGGWRYFHIYIYMVHTHTHSWGFFSLFRKMLAG